MNDLLEWIARSGGAAFGLAIFCLLMGLIVANVISTFFDFLIRLARAFTGKYPPPEPADMRPIVKCDGNCDCNKPCKCCVEDCQVGCECSSAIETE
jgi:hypothetical protein